MSNSSPSQDAFDFWEFVACGTCQLPFTTAAGPTVPFWLTECGHILCNNHLNADQSCMQCGTQQIQLVPLQLEMEAPMSDWFRSIPEWLDTVAFTSKFQLQNLAAQVQHYKSRYQRQRVFIDRLKREMGQLTHANEALSSEVNVLRQELDFRSSGGGDQNQGSGYIVNSNGKRLSSGVDPYDADHKRPKTTSSTRSIGPDRLTLPPGQQVPNLSSSRHREHVDGRSVAHNHPLQHTSQHNPGLVGIQQPKMTQRYKPPSTSPHHPSRSTHAQGVPQTFKQMALNHGPPAFANVQSHRTMPPPPTPMKVRIPGPIPGNPNHVHASGREATLASRQDRNMAPPPAPQAVRQTHNTAALSYRNVMTADSAANSIHRPSESAVLTTFTPQNSRFLALSSSGQLQNASGPTPGNASQRFFPSAYRVPSRDGRSEGSNNRLPFRPNPG